jgi:hypothetical protein
MNVSDSVDHIETGTDCGCSARRRIAAALSAMLLAAGIAFGCLAHGFSGPLGPDPGPGNFAFWVGAGMGVGLAIRFALAVKACLSKPAADSAAG